MERGEWRRHPRVGLLAVGMAAISGAYVALRFRSTSTCAEVDSWTRGGIRPRVTDACPIRPDDVVQGLAGQGMAGPGLVGTDGAWAVFDVLAATGAPLVVRVALVATDGWERLRAMAPTLAFVALAVVLAGYITVRRRRHDAAGWALLLLAGGLAASTVVHVLGLPLHLAFDDGARLLFLANVVGTYTLAWVGALWFTLEYPWPILRPARRAVVAWLPALVVAAAVVATLGVRPRSAALAAVVTVQAAVTVAVLATTVVVMVVRVRRRAEVDAVTAQQLRWVGAGWLASAALVLAFWFVPQLVVGQSLLPDAWLGLPGLIGLAAMTVALLRYRLFGLEAILRRTLVSAMLALVIVTIYVAVVALLGWRGSPTVPAATAVIAATLGALALDPARRALGRLVSRRLYGDRDDPYRALSRLGHRLVGRRGEVLPDVARDVALALRAPAVQIAVTGRAPVTVALAEGEPLWHTVPLVSRGEPIGELRVARRDAEDTFDAAEQRLLVDLAGRIAGAVREDLLDADVRAARERLVLAREEERRALRRALHDELGPTVAGLALQARTARALAERPDARDALLGTLAELSTTATRTVTEIRALAYGLRPPVLDDRGLADALRAYGEHLAPLEVRVEGDLDGPPPPAAVEVAAYRIAVGAMANVRQHAQATTCTVRLAHLDGMLSVAVEDDGRGTGPGIVPGVGLATMRERAAELGGRLEIGPAGSHGLRVVATLPVGEPDRGEEAG